MRDTDNETERPTDRLTDKQTITERAPKKEKPPTERQNDTEH